MDSKIIIIIIVVIAIIICFFIFVHFFTQKEEHCYDIAGKWEDICAS